MLETKYYKDFRHNYLILKKMDENVNSYQCRMITENKIAGLLNCRERHINGEMLLYYEITSRQSLASLYEYMPITLHFLKKLLLQLKLTRESMMGYLLTESSLLLKPEFVYVDVESGEISFLYYPFEPEENYMLSLVEFLTERVDPEDKEAVEISYRMLQLLEKEQFVLDEVLQWLEEDYGFLETTKTEKEEFEKRGIEDNVYRDTEGSDRENTEEDYIYETEENERKTKVAYAAGHEKTAFGIMLVMVAGGAFLFYLYQNYEMTQKMQIYFYVAAAGMVLTFLVCAGYLIRGKLFAENKISFGRNSGKITLQKKEEEKERFYQTFEYRDDGFDKENAEYGNTVFIPWMENCENKLYGMGKGNKNHIDLNKLPLTVGKLAGSVDMVIADQSLSRRHVKFSRDGNRICMTDLNSTNGTFKNGLRLDPNTSEILEPGDEIRLGKLKFIYR